MRQLKKNQRKPTVLLKITKQVKKNIRLSISLLFTHTTQAVVQLKPEKNSDLNRIRTHDLCDTGAVLYRLSYQAIWELVTL